MPREDTPPAVVVRRSRLRRFLLRALAVVCAVLIAVTLVIKTGAGRSWILAYISARIEERSGISIGVDSTELSILGGRAAFHGVRIQAAGRERPFVTADEVEVWFQWSALFSSPVRLDRVTVRGPAADTAMLPRSRGDAPDGVTGPLPLEIGELHWQGGSLPPWQGSDGLATLFGSARVAHVGGVGTVAGGVLEVTESSVVLTVLHPDRPPLEIDVDLSGSIVLDGTLRALDLRLLADGLGGQGSVSGTDPGHFAVEGSFDGRLGSLFPDLTETGDAHVSGRAEWSGDRFKSAGDVRLTALPAILLQPWMQGALADIELEGKTIEAEGRYDVDLPLARGEGQAPESLDLTADARLMRGGEVLLRADLSAATDGGDALPVRVGWSAELFPGQRDRCVSRGTLRLPAWDRTAGGRLEQVSVDAEFVDVGAAAERFGLLDGAVESLRPVGSVTIGLRASGPIDGPKFDGRARWVHDGSSVVAFEAASESLAKAVVVRGSLLGDQPGRRDWSATLRPHRSAGWSRPLLDGGSASFTLPDPYGAGEQFSAIHRTLMPNEPIPTWVDLLLSADPKLGGELKLDLEASGELSRPDFDARFSWVPGEDETLSVRGRGTFDVAAVERSTLEQLQAESTNLSLRRLAALLPPTTAARVLEGKLDATLSASGPVVRPQAHLALQVRDLHYVGVPPVDVLSLDLTATPEAWTVNAFDAAWADPSFGTLHVEAGIEPEYPIRRFRAAVVQTGLRGPADRIAAELEFADGVLQVTSGTLESRGVRFGAFDGTVPLIPEFGLTPLASAEGQSSVSLSDLDVGSVTSLWLTEDEDPEITGKLSGTVDVDLRRLRLAQGHARLDRFRFALGDERVEAVGALEFDLADGELTLRPGRLLAASSVISGEAPLDLAGSASLDADWRYGAPLEQAVKRLAASVDGTVNASLLAPLLGASGAGPVEMHMTGSGRPGDFKVNGTMRGRQARFLLSDPYPTRIENFDVQVRTRGDRIFLDRVTADVNGGAGTLTGVIHPGEGLELDGSFSGVRYRLGFGVTVLLDAELSLDWPASGRRRLSGDAVVQRALMNRDINLDREILRAIFDPALDTGTSRLLETVDLDLSILTDQGLIIRNNLAELRADWSALEVRGTLADPLMTGVAEVAPGGRLNLLGETLRIDAATLAWNGSPPDEPVIELETTSSREDPTIGQSWRRGWYTNDLGPGEGGSLGFWGATQQQESTLGASLATYTQDRLYGSLGRVFTRTELSYEPLPLFGETDTEARFTLSQQLSNNLWFVASNNPREAEGQTYILDIQGFRSVPSLRAQVFTGDNETAGGTLQQTLILGDKQRSDEGRRYVGRRSIELPESVKLRPVKSAVGFRKGDEFPIGAELDVEVDVAEAMRAAGYPDPTVEVTATDREENLVDLSIAIAPGPRVRFSFEGPDELPRSIRRRIRTVYRSGDDEERSLSEMRGIAERSLRSLGCLEPQVTVEPLDATSGDEHAVRLGTRCLRKANPDEPVFTGLPPDVAEFVAAGFASQLARLELAAGVLEADDHLRHTLEALGYPEARVTGRSLSDDGRRLTVAVEPGPRIYVREIRLENADATTRSNAKGLVAIREGDPLRRDWIASSARAIEADLRGRGHAAATVRPVVDRPADDPSRATVTFNVDAGRVSVVQQVTIEGLKHSNPAWVANVTDLDTDALLRKDEIAEARGRLYRTGVFERIGVTTVSMEEDEETDADEDSTGAESEGRPPAATAEAAASGLRPVAVAFELDEAPRYQLSYGGRWESDLGLGGVIDLVNRNTLGRGHRTGVRGIVNQEQRSLRLYHLIPTPLRSERSSLELYVEAKREFVEDVESRVIEAWAQLTFPLSNRVLTRVYGAVGNRRIIAGIPPSEIPLEEQVISPRFGWQLAYNTVRQDLASQRRKGFFFGLDLSGSHATLGSDLTTYGAFTQFKIFAPFGPLESGRFAWHQSYRAGTLNAREQPIPFVDRLRIGGEFSVRGYPTNSLGPLDVDGTALGGELMLAVNQEFHARVWDSLYGVLFFDAGNVWTTTSDFEHDLFRSIGFGARYTSPVGPLRLDIGFPLDRRPNDDNYQIYFGFGSVF